MARACIAIGPSLHPLQFRYAASKQRFLNRHNLSSPEGLNAPGGPLSRREFGNGNMTLPRHSRCVCAGRPSTHTQPWLELDRQERLRLLSLGLTVPAMGAVTVPSLSSSRVTCMRPHPHDGRSHGLAHGTDQPTAACPATRRRAAQGRRASRAGSSTSALMRG